MLSHHWFFIEGSVMGETRRNRAPTKAETWAAAAQIEIFSFSSDS
jgi:hypothetical protein